MTGVEELAAAEAFLLIGEEAGAGAEEVEAAREFLFGEEAIQTTGEEELEAARDFLFGEDAIQLAAARAFLLIGEEDIPIVVAQEDGGLFFAFGEEIAETANAILTEIKALKAEGEAGAERVIAQFVGL